MRRARSRLGSSAFFSPYAGLLVVRQKTEALGSQSVEGALAVYEDAVLLGEGAAPSVVKLAVGDNRIDGIEVANVRLGRLVKFGVVGNDEVLC